MNWFLWNNKQLRTSGDAHSSTLAARALVANRAGIGLGLHVWASRELWGRPGAFETAGYSSLCVKRESSFVSCLLASVHGSKGVVELFERNDAVVVVVEAPHEGVFFVVGQVDIQPANRDGRCQAAIFI